MITDKIIVKNYKCFDSEGSGFEKIMPINVIIGKNNSGKSSLIDLIQYCIKSESEFIETGRNGSRSVVYFKHKLTKKDITDSFTGSFGLGGHPLNPNYQTDLEYGQQFIGKNLYYKLRNTGTKTYFKVDFEIIPEAQRYFDDILREIPTPFESKTFCNITAERDINPESANDNVRALPNGNGATNLIQHILNLTDEDSKLIEEELLMSINIIVNPDINFTRILVQLNPNGKWEIFFEDTNNNRIALSKMGSGVKTILIVLLNLIVRPEFENKSQDSYVFAFEELENNLHPALQRRLYNYIKEYSEKVNTYFFLTTHSNVVIDTFGTYEHSQIIHVVHDGIKAKASTILSYNETKQIINDLGLKASDILQSNGIIWVEGPSDRIYINAWLNIIAPELKEGLHYSIMFYGGRLLSNLTFDFDWFNEDIIPLIKINTNAYVIIDRDGKTMTSKINSTKQRISEEIGESKYWITKGREIENYLSDEVIMNWLEEKHSSKSIVSNNKNNKLENNISDSGAKLEYNRKKNLYSSEIAQFITKDSITVLDLNNKLKELVENIREWNK